ncbi:unnamed protein product [Prorocentrum cordatum]|uniref:Uncharacterized protein n=1 Tax=Prorocentrum cordatum TaxID=2364126 RepID=A0ABN9RBA6_9DINO|nr:unnamed protein product [Polarella glacialis]
MRRPEGEVRPRSTCGGASGDHWLLRELAAMDERLSRQLCKVQEQVVRLEDRLASSMEARSAAVEGKQAATEYGSSLDWQRPRRACRRRWRGRSGRRARTGCGSSS